MTEETILNHAIRQVNRLIPILGDRLSSEEFVIAVRGIIREAMNAARKEALKGN